MSEALSQSVIRPKHFRATSFSIFLTFAITYHHDRGRELATRRTSKGWTGAWARVYTPHPAKLLKLQNMFELSSFRVAV